ncbi:MAG: hypothetical protein BWX88_00433 [Planctomycetes bacterium ADurb.Bin126]|nr:MAG: hypothetical protein BWX88_00433 [Planctomycetes bacterium ADurb.Bin126]HOD80182.1 hypothetical protein [Phycisphaerae bacterium]HQL71654.1 hypothetical protein [Phycisphaerae bacterium]
MRRWITASMMMALSFTSVGCMGRLFREGLGAATGASGKVVENGPPVNLTKYKSLHIQPLTLAPGLQAPADLTDVIQGDFVAAATNRGFTLDGKPGLKLAGEIIHYETSSTVDTAIGPLAEVIVRAKLIDAQSGQVVAQANLVGRSKATSSSGARNVSGGAGKALGKWLAAGGLKKEKGEEDDE